MKSLSAVLIGKSIAKLTRVFKIGGGSAAPGLYSLKIDPNLIISLNKNVLKNLIITGTNGKTTTAKLLAHFAREEGIDIIHNSTGSNMERGIASTLISKANVFGKLPQINLGIWEVDEASFNVVAPKVKPDVIVFLNAFRDQLDRYGEVNSVVSAWQQTLKKIDGKTIIIINGDDCKTSTLNKNFTGKSISFGLENQKIQGEGENGKGVLDFEAKNIKLNGLIGSEFSFIIHNSKFKIHLPVPGVYNIYNFLAAFLAGINLGFSTENMIKSLKTFSPAFGRVEKVILKEDKTAYLFLIKNPVGATEVFSTIAPNLKENDRLLLILNDNIADGTDVSWIWDAEFDRLIANSYSRLAICSGSRSYDLALRLKYAGFDLENIHIEPDIEKAFKEAQKDLKGDIFILPTYTAMLEIQKILTLHGLKKDYWKEDIK